MKLIASFFIVIAFCLSSLSQDDKFVYADFEKVENGRAVSNNGGLVQIYTGNDQRTPMPEVRIDGPDHGAAETGPRQGEPS